MGIENWSENVLLVNLPAELKESNELETIANMVRDRRDCDVVIDFSSVHMMHSSTIAQLIRLREQLIENGRQLVLCSVPSAIRGIFVVTAIESTFEFADDKSEALTRVQLMNNAHPSAEKPVHGR